MSMLGVALSRPSCSLEHVRLLLQTAASIEPTNTRSSSSWFAHRSHLSGLIKRMSSLRYGGQHIDDGPFSNLNGFPHQPKRSSQTRSKLQEGGANYENKDENYHPFSRKSPVPKESSLLLSLVQEIQPLDVSQISKEASPDSTDAMKRTISGMLGLLPSDQFEVGVETSREPLAKLLVSSMMTGYTLRNAEYRLCLQRSLEVSDEEVEWGYNRGSVKHEVHFGEVESILEPVLHDEESTFLTGRALGAIQGDSLVFEEDEDLSLVELRGPVSEEVQNYINDLQQKLESVSKELEECKRVNMGLQVQNIVGEEKNDLLDYLRSLAPDKVAELSQPTSSEVEDVIQNVINELLENPVTKLHHKGPPFGSPQASSGCLNGLWEDDCLHKLSSSPLQSQSAVLVNRDHLARLLFWCMLLGHHMRGLEYRLELSRTLSLSGDIGPAMRDTTAND